jgi:hypothetical protein
MNTHCAKGHKLTPDNIYACGDSRRCRICKLAGIKKWKERFKLGIDTHLDERLRHLGFELYLILDRIRKTDRVELVGELAKAMTIVASVEGKLRGK